MTSTSQLPIDPSTLKWVGDSLVDPPSYYHQQRFDLWKTLRVWTCAQVYSCGVVEYVNTQAIRSTMVESLAWRRGGWFGASTFSAPKM